jgi:hypothetical protein
MVPWWCSSCRNSTCSHLQFLFAHVILEGYPALPLWNMFEDQLGAESADFLQVNHSCELTRECTLQVISKCIKDGCQSLTAYGLPEPVCHSREVVEEIRHYAQHARSLAAHCLEMVSNMNNEQKSLYDHILNVVRQRHDHDILPLPLFVEGFGEPLNGTSDANC